MDCYMLPCARAHLVRAPSPIQGVLRALAPEGIRSHGRGRRVRSRCAPREGEGRRTEWRSAAKRELHGGYDKMGEACGGGKFPYLATAFADLARKWVQRPRCGMIVFPKVARMRHNLRPARSLGDATSEAGPSTAACSPSGGQRRRMVGESEERPQVSVRVPHAQRVHDGTPKQRSAACLHGGRQ